jgi:importin subunit alpha-6/7
MSSPDTQVREQAVWALGNIAGDSPNCRDYVLQFNIIDALLLMTREGSRPSLLRNATWTISNLCRGKPAPPFQLVSVCLKDLARLLYSPDEQVIIDACWALSYLSDGDNVRIQAVMEAEVGLRVVELLMHSSPAVQTPALRVVGNIVTGDDLQTQCIINFQALPRLRTLLLTTAKKGIRKEVCWTISNITAGTPHQIKAVIDADLIGPLILQLSEADFDIKKEAAWAIANATSSGTADQVKYGR